MLVVAAPSRTPVDWRVPGEAVKYASNSEATLEGSARFKTASHCVRSGAASGSSAMNAAITPTAGKIVKIAEKAVALALFRQSCWKAFQ